MVLAYPVSLPITALLLVFAGAAALLLLRPRETVLWPSVALLAVALGAGFHYATWRAVLNDQGIRVISPLSPFHPAGEMLWADLRGATLRSYGRRHRNETLHLNGMTGRLSVPIGDMNPDEAERLAAEIQRHAAPYGVDIGGAGFRQRVRTYAGVEGFAPALLRLREDD